jgi:acyl dehydratase
VRARLALIACGLPIFDSLERQMTSSSTNGLVTDIAGLREHAGTHVGYTEWHEMTQERVNQFADATDDHQFIHVDVEKAKQTPFGGTIAHGFLTLSLVAPTSQELMKVTDAAMGVNYGLDRVRFPAPLPVGKQWRGGLEILEVNEIPGGLQIKSRVTIEVKDSEKPACVAESLVRVYGGQ